MWQVLSIGLLIFSLLPSVSAQTTQPVQFIVPIASVTNSGLNFDNRGQPQRTIKLYEAWPASHSQRQPNPALRVHVPSFAQKIDPNLLSNWRKAANQPQTMLVFLADQADLSQASAISDWAERGDYVYKTLTEHAQQTQAPLIDKLRSQGVTVQSLWIVNSLIIEGDQQLALDLAQQPVIASIAANQTWNNPHLTATPATAPENFAWGLTAVNAPQVWGDWGVRGQGIVVANIDTGVTVSHTALLKNYRGWSANGLSNDYNWFDPTYQYRLPTDPAGHGTHTMGTLAGTNDRQGMALGVAPAARWIAARACDSWACNEAALMRSAQWMLAPTRVGCERNQQIACDPRPDLRPHIINNSWGGSGESTWYSGYISAWDAAGIMSVFAAGNLGSDGCRTSATPGNNPNVFSVGAVDSNNLIADFSSRGPTSDGRTNPDLSGPGVRVPSAWPDGSTAFMNGTSMAAPHVSGIAALIWSANPQYIGNLAATQALLTDTTVPRYSAQCGDSATARPNNVYGWGSVDAYAAVSAARVDVAWLNLPEQLVVPANAQITIPITLDSRQVSVAGTYRANVLIVAGASTSTIELELVVQAAPNTSQFTGQLVDFWHGRGVYGRVSVGNGPSVYTDQSGRYTMTLTIDNHQLNAQANGYHPNSASVDLALQTTKLVTMTPDIPHVQAEIPVISTTLNFAEQRTIPITLSNLGTQPLTIQPQIPNQDWQITPAPSVALYATSGLAELKLKDDQIYTDALDLGFHAPLFGRLANKLYLSSNGWVSLNQTGFSAPSSNCFPANNLPNATFAAFWTDLDPSKGGIIRAGNLDPDTFVASFENVPLWQDENSVTPAPTYSFQIIIKRSGLVEYRYASMDSVPSKWGIGTHSTTSLAQAIGCHQSHEYLTTQNWHLRNQPTSAQWLSVQPSSLTIAPNQQAIMQVQLKGFGAMAWLQHPALGVVRLNTNDPRQAQIAVSAHVGLQMAPYQTYANTIVISNPLADP
ncbi:S8 family serine peptidase [Herpetosiphon sp. NSE202]|uniref:S8 family serine peptidase n=1 Tax=Herpetosiphon sp. NSE202 TaxID=3351349 RepID=UPI0036252888